MERYPDIEIYLVCGNIERLQQWLGAALDSPVIFKRAGKGKWRSETQLDSKPVAILFMESAVDGFDSLWFDSAATPWARDVDCARAANRFLGVEVRCSLGSWQPGDDPDRFFKISPDGTEEVIDWPDSGQ
ncbi:hypothetical protein [Phytohalomonas tamaricis]|uniref:hypothetical protein n=1 Tax=Phytohalomonas tamaricis TaxID=2081032 RepID=UPI0021D45FC3|nr:hypothetical protein [Phytohalomonas tamaricis]